MKVTGIIAEYNPFHRGHAYHIARTRECTGADYCVVVMSGDFVQRGGPAILDKFTRARMALQHGADLVLELPVTAALSSAEGFATGGTCLLDRLGVADTVSFGCEAADPVSREQLSRIAHLLATEPIEYRKSLSSYLRQGLSFPAARMRAVCDVLTQNASDTLLSDPETLLSSPNNILAIEYLKAIHRHQLSLTPCMISREGSSYHETTLSHPRASATALRRTIFSHPEEIEVLRSFVPESVYAELETAQQQKRFLREEDFSDLLYFVLREHLEELSDYGTSDSGLSGRIAHELEHFTSWPSFLAEVKSKNQTYTAISRYFSHVLLGLTREQLQLAASGQFAPYARVLGFRKDAAPLLKQMRQTARIPILMRLSRDQNLLNDDARKLLALDLRASDLYNHLVFAKSGLRIASDYRHPLITI